MHQPQDARYKAGSSLGTHLAKIFRDVDHNSLAVPHAADALSPEQVTPQTQELPA